jgi:hypothetical protein
MGLKEVLSKMKIVEMDVDEVSGLEMPPSPTSTSAPPTPPPSMSSSGRATDIRDLLGTMPPPPEFDEKSMAAAASSGGADGDGADIPDFPSIYKVAGIADPPHGYTAHKVLEILSSSDFANLDSKAKAAALTGFLKMNPGGPVPISDVVQDAVRRDQALDKFEDFLRTKLKGRTEQMEKENARLQKEIDELVQRNREKMDANRRALEAEEARLAQWQLSKKAEERRLFDAVSPFVEANPITTGEASSASPSSGPAVQDQV